MLSFTKRRKYSKFYELLLIFYSLRISSVWLYCVSKPISLCLRLFQDLRLFRFVVYVGYFNGEKQLLGDATMQAVYFLKKSNLIQLHRMYIGREIGAMQQCQIKCNSFMETDGQYKSLYRGYSPERQLKQPFGEMSTSIFNQFTFMSHTYLQPQLGEKKKSKHFVFNKYFSLV